MCDENSDYDKIHKEHVECLVINFFYAEYIFRVLRFKCVKKKKVNLFITLANRNVSILCFTISLSLINSIGI